MMSAKFLLMFCCTAAISSVIEPELSMTKMISTGFCRASPLPDAGARRVAGCAAVAGPRPPGRSRRGPAHAGIRVVLGLSRVSL